MFFCFFNETVYQKIAFVIFFKTIFDNCGSFSIGEYGEREKKTEKKYAICCSCWYL